MKKIFSIVAVFLSIIFLSGIAESFEIPQFKIIWKEFSTFGILFDQKLSDNQVEQIIYEFREIRKRREFYKYFPQTTPGGKDKYTVIQIQIFTNPKWSSEKMMKDFLKYKMSKKMEKQYFNNIRGYYGWSNLKTIYERGSIGDCDDKLKSKNYRELFLIH
jgi:hypothetical protein